MQTGLCLCCFHCNGDQPDIIIARRTIFLQINSRKNVRHERRDDQRANETQFRFNFCEKIFIAFVAKKNRSETFPFLFCYTSARKKKKKKDKKKTRVHKQWENKKKKKVFVFFQAECRQPRLERWSSSRG